MSMSKKCKLYKFLFRVLPLNAWQVRLMDKHFAICPRCREEKETDEGVKELLVSLEDSNALPAVWQRLQGKIQEEETVKPVPKPKKGLSIFHKWQWAAVGVALLLMILLLPFSLTFDKEPIDTSGTGEMEEKEDEQVVVESVKIDSHAAKIYFFNSKDPNKLIVWVKK